MHPQVGNPYIPPGSDSAAHNNQPPGGGLRYTLCDGAADGDVTLAGLAGVDDCIICAMDLTTLEDLTAYVAGLAVDTINFRDGDGYPIDTDGHRLLVVWLDRII